MSSCSDYDGETAFCLSLRKEFTDISLYLLSQGCVRDGIDPATSMSLLSTAVKLKELQVISYSLLIARLVHFNSFGIASFVLVLRKNAKFRLRDHIWHVLEILPTVCAISLVCECGHA